MATKLLKMNICGLWVLELRLLAVGCFFAFCFGVTVELYGVIWLTCAIISALIYLFFAIIYFPIRYFVYKCEISQKFIKTRSGVFFIKTKYMYTSAVKYISEYQSPLCRVFNIKTLIVVAAGGTVIVPFVKSNSADTLKTMLNV